MKALWIVVALLFVFIVAGASSLASVEAGPACPTPTPTPPTAVQFTNFTARVVGPGLIMVTWQTVSEVDLRGMYLLGQGRGRISPYLPAQFPGMPLSGGYMWRDTTPTRSVPCYGLEYLDASGQWNVWWPVPEVCAR